MERTLYRVCAGKVSLEEENLKLLLGYISDKNAKFGNKENTALHSAVWAQKTRWCRHLF
ncbi:MAG: hypothetical protein K0R73_1456 [Candidatus Midichloriaceae bacterium]|jgi:hypothetical protein|nr:hypothetical protein [Candidatus Midichloriaceae bacterium]